MAVTEFGDPAGRPLIWCHGGLSSGGDAAPFDAPARELGVRVIAPDRPGIGRSAPQPGCTLLDFAEQALALADGPLLAAGWSAGGPHALAIAHAAPARVERCAALASSLPLDRPGLRKRLGREDRMLLPLCEHAPPLARAALSLTVRRPSIERVRRDVEKTVPDAFPGLAEAVSASVEAGTGGVVEDYRRFGAPWGFEPAEVTVPVDVWQGDADPLVPAEWGRTLAAELPHGTLHERPGWGHGSAVSGDPRGVLAALLG